MTTLESLKLDLYFALAEHKIELIENKLIISNNLKNSLATMQLILAGWGADAAIALAPITLWWEAIRNIYAEILPPVLREPNSEKHAQEWLEWSQSYSHWQIAYPIKVQQFHAHNEVRWKLIMDFYEKIRHWGDCLGRDLAMKLGEDVFTPDIYFLANEHLDRQYSYYLDGPADIVMEILIREFEEADRVLKFCKYEKAGVPEYWILDPAKKIFEAYQLRNGSFCLAFSDSDGYYNPSRLPGIKLDIKNIWTGSWSELNRNTLSSILVEGPISEPVHRPNNKADIYWGSIPFTPRISLAPVKITAEELIAWTPESKFELYDGRLVIGGYEGTRNVLGMTLMTFGMLEAIALLPAKMWIENLLALGDPIKDKNRKAEALELARKSAKVLRDKHNVRRIAVAGDLLRDTPWNSFSEVELVVWDDLGDSSQAWRNIKDIFGKTLFIIHEPKHTRVEEYYKLEQQILIDI
ncbi:MAG: Uma2 family endonuclease [Acidobacteriota bacterium]